ncbi:MAG: hypothetical protein CVT66_11410 [Actinobacteria bacterium HGW-Actinobacteria-6]|jgi:uncharacterized protein with HEPN domain|nr:MAG: hypothetical protein CVT66_11410 [Actinobacteria bacterium HGW-Actinobacteria-6]
MWRDEAYALDMLIAARKTRIYLGVTDIASLNADAILQDAIVRQLGVLGEAAARISDDFRVAHTEVPWRDIIGMRNRLVHDYWSIDVAEVWRTVTNDLPALIAVLEDLAPAE